MVVLKALFVMIALLLVADPAHAASGSGLRAADHEIKAAFIYNFTKFVTWPSTAFVNNSEPLRICIMDDDELGAALEVLAKKSKSRQIQVVGNRNNSDTDKCHLLFINESTDAVQTKKMLNSVASRPILTVGESPSFIQQGGIIRFIPTRNNLTFEINAATARRSGLGINAKLLNLSKKVGDQP